MPEGYFIKRHPTGRRPDSFEELRRQGIELAQGFCGELWTDFNLHDPGVTILEQLSYAITDLIYRADLPTADLLSGEAGIDYRRQALYAPELIFPCRPTTGLDYRKALLDAVSELDNCWLLPVREASGECSGLYRILLKLDQTMPQSQREAAAAKVERWLYQHRNLGEDLAEIVFQQELEYELCARIEVSSARRPVEILAEIYFNCARRIAGSVQFQDYAEAQRADRSLEEVFDGPFTRHGLLQDGELLEQSGDFPVSALYAAVSGVAGVDRIDSLYVERDNEPCYDAIECKDPVQALKLRIPQQVGEVKVELTVNGRVMPVALEELRVRIEELNFRYYSSRTVTQELSMLYRLPEGSARPVTEYFSIQNQFPANYGIGSYGVPDSAAPHVKARAKQLKAYLLIFEQFMVNYLANLQALPELFSIDKGRRASYASMALSERQISGLAELYPADPAATLARIVSEFDDYHGRKNRLLDYLLALYGESFSQHSLRHFNYYHPPQEVEQRIIDNKIDFLQAVVELGRDRAAAANYRGTDRQTQSRSGLQRRVGLLLDFPQSDGFSLAAALHKAGLKLMPHEDYERQLRGTAEFRFIDPASGRLVTPPLWEAAASFDPETLRRHIGDAIPLRHRRLSGQLLWRGVSLERFRLFSQPHREVCQLCLQLDDGRYWRLGSYPDRKRGIAAANCLRRLLIDLNRASEGMHLLEHILLRPLGSGHTDPELPPADDFYGFRISVIFPAWSARCRDSQFRLLAEETVRLNTPAHLYPECYWLDFPGLCEFEALYGSWLDLKSESPADVAAIDALSGELIRFLHAQRKAGGVGVGP